MGGAGVSAWGVEYRVGDGMNGKRMHFLLGDGVAHFYNGIPRIFGASRRLGGAQVGWLRKAPGGIVNSRGCARVHGTASLSRKRRNEGDLCRLC